MFFPAGSKLKFIAIYTLNHTCMRFFFRDMGCGLLIEKSTLHSEAFRNMRWEANATRPCYDVNGINV